MANKHFNIIVSGKVQGVFYRASTKEKAKALGVKGFVKNQADGSVYIEAEGDEAILTALLDWCRIGPEMAVVEDLQVEEGDVKGYSVFEIKRY